MGALLAVLKGGLRQAHRTAAVCTEKQAENFSSPSAAAYRFYAINFFTPKDQDLISPEEPAHSHDNLGL